MKLAELGKEIKDNDLTMKDLKNELGTVLLTMSNSRFPLTVAHNWVTITFFDDPSVDQFKVINILLNSTFEIGGIDGRVVEDAVNDVIFELFVDVN